jgi:sulfoxide reductase heme-binding subunit YedZ
VLHVGALLLDTVVPFSLAQELVPFTAGYRPVAVGLGVVAAELTAAVGISNALRKQIPHRVWRRIHYLTLAVWAFATLHGLLAGTDRLDPWFAALAGMAISATLMAAWARFATDRVPA